jgi:hypothetical protein
MAFRRLSDYNSQTCSYCYQGLDDDRVNVEYNKLFIRKSSGIIDLIPTFGHRFDESKFKIILSRIHNNFLEPDL